MRAKPRLKAVLTIRSKLFEYTRDWLNKQGFTEIQGPIFLPGGAEKPNHFKVDFFGKTAYLSGGLNPYSDSFLELFNKIYTIAPTFRAEQIESKRHLAEYWRIEAVSKCHFEDMLGIHEQMLTDVIHTLVKACSKEFTQLNIDTVRLKQVKKPFPRLTYEEAIEKLQNKGFKIFWGQPVDRKREITLTQMFNQPFFITQFPVSGETLFHKSVPHRSELTLSAELFAPHGFGEISGCNELITQKKLLKERLRTLEIEPAEQKWFLDLKSNVGPQSVCVIGVERLLQWLCNCKSISDVIAFPRVFGFSYS
jgi:asparaginyl-tRNA synthetase